MDAISFIKEAWAKTDEEERKQFIRANVGKISQAELEKELLARLQKAGWNVGLLMVAQRILQVIPSEPILHGLLQLIADGASYVPNGAAMRQRLQTNLDGLIAKNPALAEAQRRFTALRKSAKKAVDGATKRVRKVASGKAAASKAGAKKAAKKKVVKTKPAAKAAAKKKAPTKKK